MTADRVTYHCVERVQLLVKAAEHAVNLRWADQSSHKE